MTRLKKQEAKTKKTLATQVNALFNSGVPFYSIKRDGDAVLRKGEDSQKYRGKGNANYFAEIADVLKINNGESSKISEFRIVIPGNPSKDYFVVGYDRKGKIAFARNIEPVIMQYLGLSQENYGKDS